MRTNLLAEIRVLLAMDDGPLSLLPLGIVPDESRTQRLRVLLRALYRETESNDLLDREIAECCATILRVAHGCILDSPTGEMKQFIVGIAQELAQGAHEILMGNRLDYRIPVRHDLEYCTHDSNGVRKWHPVE